MRTPQQLAARRKYERERYATDKTYREHRKALSRKHKSQIGYKEASRAYARKRWATDAEYRERHRAAVRRSHLKCRYGLTQEDADRLIKKYRNRCGICKEEKPLVIDHDHSTGRVRGLLCRKCNTNLGRFGDNKRGVLRALKYLHK